MEVCFYWLVADGINTALELAPALLVISSLYDIDFLFPFVAAFGWGGGGGIEREREWLID